MVTAALGLVILPLVMWAAAASAQGEPTAAPGPDLCATADRLLRDGLLDDADALYEKLRAVDSGDPGLKRCGQEGAARVAAARLDTDPTSEPIDRAETWWQSFLEDFLIPSAAFVGQALVIGMVATASAKVLGLLPLLQGWPSTGSALAVAAVALVVTGFGLSLAWGEDGWVDAWKWAIVAGLVLATLLLIAGLLIASARAKLAAGVAIGLLVFTAVWLHEELNEPIDPEEWVGIGLGLLAVLASTVAFVMVQATTIRLQFGTFKGPDDKAGEAFGAATEAQFFALGKDEPRGVTLVRGTDQTSLPAAAVTGLGANKVLEVVLRLLRAFTPSTTYRVTGQLHPQAEAAAVNGTAKGAPASSSSPAAVTVAFRRAFRSSTMVTIPSTLFVGEAGRRPSLPFASSDLATAAAAWVLVNLLSEQRRGRRRKGELSGATQWQSVALQAVAASEDVRADAGPLLARAVGYDPGNRAARFGWARALMSPRREAGRSADDWEQAAARTHDIAIAELEGLLNDECLTLALRLRVLYNLAGAHLQRCWLPECQPHQARQAAYYAQWVVHLARAGLNDSALQPVPAPADDGVGVPLAKAPTDRELKTPELKAFLLQLLPITVFVWAGARVTMARTGAPGGGFDDLTALIREVARSTTPRGAYNAACLFCAGGDDIDVASSVFGHGPPAPSGQRERKNLAEALTLLELALQEPNLRVYPREDPSLRLLWESDEFGPRFWALTEEPPEPEPAPALPQVHHVLLGTAPVDQ